MSVGDEGGSPGEIELRLGAELTNLPIIRSLTSSIAMRADFDLDAIADLKLAVDEACSTLITRATPEATLRCRFRVSKDEIRFVVSIPSASDAKPSRSPVQANAESISASYQSGAGPCVRWMKSVSRYGALGKKTSHETSSAALSGSTPRRERAYAAPARTSGTQARKRFQTRKR